ncbi:MAG: hypothetical protein UY58_C0002G0014 [Candidatus Magasanikbacteria bacterium GW2011_GWA2_50_22]|uniref:Uncharacterized protein n=1 Tax=Candidatus Magasanikbacteria bacterium GW2011_GWA2_50_22 TaxID=1619043 RepID=A0A0G1WFG5_9BACT|nr:MAG: hypothetical protein UY58_C0002G0014 [Candidatus Magasanikbacteria bacterium GW2011_GWA2_50_22]
MGYMDEDKIIQKLVEIDQKLEGVATKDELSGFRQDVMDGLDKQLVILQRLDQERLFSIERVKRIEEDVERIKLQLRVA